MKTTFRTAAVRKEYLQARLAELQAQFDEANDFAQQRIQLQIHKVWNELYAKQAA